MKPGSLQEVLASCMFARLNEEGALIDIIHIAKGTVLMSLGYEESSEDDMTANFHFKFLYGEHIVTLPIYVNPELYETEEEIVEAIQTTLFPSVKSVSQGIVSSRSSERTSYLIGDSRGNDEFPGYDEFH